MAGRDLGEVRRRRRRFPAAARLLMLKVFWDKFNIEFGFLLLKEYLCKFLPANLYLLN